MAEDREELIAHYRRTRARMLAAIEGLTDAQMGERTLDGWSVGDHLSHIALWDEARALEVARISAGHEAAYRMTEEQDAVYNGLAHDLRAAWSPAQARWEFESTRRRLLEALAAATPRGLDPHHYGEAGLRSSHEEGHAEWIARWRREKGY